MFAALDLASSNGDVMDLDNDTSGQSTRGHLLLTCGDPSAHPKLPCPCLIIASACMKAYLSIVCVPLEDPPLGS